MKTVSLRKDAAEVLQAYKDVTGVSKAAFASSAIWEKIGRLPKEQHSKVMQAYNLRTGKTPQP